MPWFRQALSTVTSFRSSWNDTVNFNECKLYTYEVIICGTCTRKICFFFPRFRSKFLTYAEHWNFSFSRKNMKWFNLFAKPRQNFQHTDYFIFSFAFCLNIDSYLNIMNVWFLLGTAKTPNTKWRMNLIFSNPQSFFVFSVIIFSLPLFLSLSALTEEI